MFQLTISSSQAAQETLLPPLVDRAWLSRVEEEDETAKLVAFEALHHRSRKLLLLRDKSAPKPIGLSVLSSSSAAVNHNMSNVSSSNYSRSRHPQQQQQQQQQEESSTSSIVGNRMMMRSFSDQSFQSQEDNNHEDDNMSMNSISRPSATRARTGTADQMDFSHNDDVGDLFSPTSFVSMGRGESRFNASDSSVDISVDNGSASPHSSPDDMFSYTYNDRSAGSR